MEIVKFLSTFFILCSSLMAHGADKHCFSNLKEHQAIKEQLPTILKKLPVYLVTDNFLVKAIAALEPGPQYIRFFFNASRGLEDPIETNVRVCADENQIELIFDNGVKELIEIRGESEIYVRKLITMQKVESHQYSKTSQSIEKLSLDPTAAIPLPTKRGTR